MTDMPTLDNPQDPQQQLREKAKVCFEHQNQEAGQLLEHAVSLYTYDLLFMRRRARRRPLTASMSIALETRRDTHLT